MSATTPNAVSELEQQGCRGSGMTFTRRPQLVEQSPSAHVGGESNRVEDPCGQLAEIVRNDFGAHPFATTMDTPRLEALLPEYLAMSVAFRYLQAAAQKDVIFAAIHENRSVPEAIEVMNSVGNFLSWDESGGVDLLLEGGKEMLPEILDTDRLHSELLRADARRMLGHAIEPHYGPATRRYLLALYRGLASMDVVVRCAHMVAFELHAGIMIDSLWGAVATTGLPREELAYFRRHVGGEDPAEKYHIEMTQRMIARVVAPTERERFLAEFRRAYGLHIEWCRACMQMPCAPTPAIDDDVLHAGSCHCGGVKFEVRAPAAPRVVRCNCSICEMSGFLHLLVPAERFRLISGGDLLSNYRFNTGIATHMFCKVCGTKPFYRPRSNPDGFSVNVRCLDRSTVESMEISDFDGQHWEEGIREGVATNG